MSAILLGAQRCLYHATREAVARCPECGSSYCRECIAEHEGRIVCATCLQRLLSRPPEVKKPLGRVMGLLMGSFAGLMLAWLSFYGFGRLLMQLPSAFHAAEIWGEELASEKEME